MAEGLVQKTTTSDTVLVVVLLGIMLIFLLRNLIAFRREGLAISRPKKQKDKLSGSEGEENEDEEEEEEGEAHEEQEELHKER